jgi:hypothetical protein
VLTACYAVLASSSSTLSGELRLEPYLRPVAQPGRPTLHLAPVLVPEGEPVRRPAHVVAELLARHGWDRLRLGQLPASLAVPLLEALSASQQDPLPGWSLDVLRVVGREDLARNSRLTDNTTAADEQLHTAFKCGSSCSKESSSSSSGPALDGLEAWLAIKNPPKNTHLKNRQKMGFWVFWFFFKFLICYENNTNFSL